MKKRSLTDLLKKVEAASTENNSDIINLNDELVKNLIKGGYQISNGTCGGNNSSCDNTSCPSGSNGECRNGLCLI